jgi:hypothetical protein
MIKTLKALALAYIAPVILAENETHTLIKSNSRFCKEMATRSKHYDSQVEEMATKCAPDLKGRRGTKDRWYSNSLSNIWFYSDSKDSINKMNTCTKTEERGILRDNDSIETIIRTAYKSMDKKTAQFIKWFGYSTAQDDENIKVRFKRAMDMMFAENRKWSLLCCRKYVGACKICSDRDYRFKRNEKFVVTK